MRLLLLLTAALGVGAQLYGEDRELKGRLLEQERRAPYHTANLVCADEARREVGKN